MHSVHVVLGALVADCSYQCRTSHVRWVSRATVSKHSAVYNSIPLFVMCMRYCEREREEKERGRKRGRYEEAWGGREMEREENRKGGREQEGKQGKGGKQDKGGREDRKEDSGYGVYNRSQKSSPDCASREVAIIVLLLENISTYTCIYNELHGYSTLKSSKITGVQHLKLIICKQ